MGKSRRGRAKSKATAARRGRDSAAELRLRSCLTFVNRHLIRATDDSTVLRRYLLIAAVFAVLLLVVVLAVALVAHLLGGPATGAVGIGSAALGGWRLARGRGHR